MLFFYDENNMCRGLVGESQIILYPKEKTKKIGLKWNNLVPEKRYRTYRAIIAM